MKSYWEALQELEQEVYSNRSYFKVKDGKGVRDEDSDDEVIDLVSSDEEEEFNREPRLVESDYLTGSQETAVDSEMEELLVEEKP